MFDPRTEQLISAAPKLRASVEDDLAEVNPENLAQELSKAFAEVASIKLQTRDEPERIDPITYRQFARRLHRMANTFEAIVCIGRGATNQPAAFVAGIARQLAFDINPVTTGQPRNTYLNSTSISSDISAMLLFVAAEAHADARAAAERLESLDDSLPRSQLLFLLRCLGRAEFDAIDTWAKTVGLPPVAIDTSLSDQATDVLYNEISRGITNFAREMLGEAEQGSSEAIFRSVQDRASSHSYSDVRPPIRYLFGGPHHLSRLLLAATSSLGQLALVGTPPPSGVDDPDSWASALRSLAKKRPLVWKNHRGALDGGLLDHGVSAVMNFPTGSGKTTLAVLKILATHHGKGRTLYLAPTHALCDQVRDDLRSDLGRGVSVIVGDKVGDIQISFPPDVVVMTPEQCLATLAFDPSAFTDVGLLVFDECHLLHPSKSRQSRRSLDAMLSLLAFVEVVPNADLLLLSAMIKNASELALWISSIKPGECFAFEDAWRPTRQARAVVVYDEREIGRIKSLATTPNALPFAVFNLKRNWNPLNPDGFAIRKLLSETVELDRKGRNVKSNRNVVAATIAIAAQKKDSFRSPKVLIFAENKVFVTSIANKLRAAISQILSPPSLEEKNLFRMIITEFGPDITPINSLDQTAVIHHGD
jgi:hypothetical protein